jgi:hypothetical protein
MTPELRVACARAVHVRTATGGILFGGRAVVFLLPAIGFPKVARMLSWPPVLFFVELLYRLVANNRRFFARFLFRKERPLPTPGPG